MGAGAGPGLVLFARACERVFVSIKGQPYTWLRASLQRGDLAGVRSAALELWQVNLADALAIRAADERPPGPRLTNASPSAG
jgi:hypothetical protein